MSIDTEMPVTYNPSDAAIAEIGTKFAGLAETVDEPGGYKRVSEAIAVVRTMRTGVEKRRVDLKKSALEWGRKVDSEAKRLTELLLVVETPLKEAKQRVDDFKADREKAEREAATKEEQARIRAAQLAEDKRLAGEREILAKERAAQEAERKRIEAEREAAAAERRKAEAELQVERDRIAAEQREIEHQRFCAEEKERLVREANERQAQKERDRVAAEEAELARVEAERVRQERILALRPDGEKLAAYGRALLAVEPPAVGGEAEMVLFVFQDRLQAMVKKLAAWPN